MATAYEVKIHPGWSGTMMVRFCCGRAVAAVMAVAGLVSIGAAQGRPNPAVEQGRLIAPGSAPFHLRASIDGGRAEVEMYWLAPDHWRRTIKSPEFVQTMIVDGDRVFEQDSPAYFPVDLRTLTTAMVDPQPIVDALQPGDRVQTKANGMASESGSVCFDEKHTMCGIGRGGLREFLGASGHTVEFMNYQPFHGKRIARRLTYTVSAGDFTDAEVTELEDLKHPGASLFAIEAPTPVEQQLRIVDLNAPQLMELASEKQQVIWPQVLEENAPTGEASFYVSLDRTGKVREVHPLSIACERANDSVVRQLLRWKFRPALSDGRPVQAEGILTFHFNTREWGPKETLSDAEARKLAVNRIAPNIPAGRYPPGTEYKLWIAVDSDGVVIEKIVAGGPSDLFGPIDTALKQWRFSPVLENGQPRPYRALLVFPIS